MKLYFYISNGKQKVSFYTFPKTSKSRFDIYNKFGKEFKIGYYNKTYTPNDIYAIPDNKRLLHRIVCFILLAMLATLCYMTGYKNCTIVNVAIFVVYIVVYCITENKYLNDLEKCKEFNKEIDLTKLK